MRLDMLFLDVFMKLSDGWEIEDPRTVTGESQPYLWVLLHVQHLVAVLEKMLLEGISWSK